MNLTFLAHDEEGKIRLIKRNTQSSHPNVEEEWARALEIWRDKVPLLGDLTLIGALTTNAPPGIDPVIRWFPDTGEDLTAERVGQTLH